MFGNYKIMSAMNYDNNLHKHELACIAVTEEEYYKLKGNIGPNISTYNTYYDENTHKKLVEMPPNVNITRELSSGKNMFIDSKHVSFIRTSGITTNINQPKEIISISNKRIFPPILPTRNINNNIDNVAIGAVNDRSSFRGLRKQFSGRFKRLVSKQPKASNQIIPPELKPQLKAIYVY